MGREAVTRDRFLGGRLTLFQPSSGYRAGVDAVLLAAAVPARPGHSVLDLGCGVGAAALCLQTRVGGIELFGLELMSQYAELARRNAQANDLAFEVLTGDLREVPERLRARNFTHVLANPPYYRVGGGTAAHDTGRRTALTETTSLDAWTDAAIRRLTPKGYLTMIQKADRLPDLLAALDGRVGCLRILPIAPRPARDAELVIVQARKGGRGGARLKAPFILHRGERHVADGEDYTEAAQAILRHAEPLPMT